MFERRSLRWPITLGVIMIVLLVAIAVGWVLLAVPGAHTEKFSPLVYWAFLAVGALFLALVLVGVVLYLTLSVKAINLNRRQSNFIDSVTHELKSPLASLKLYLQTLNRRQVSIDEQRNFFRFMLEDVERLDGLINHLLVAARMENKSAEADTEDVEISTLRECADEVCLQHRVPGDIISFKMQPCVVRGRRVDLDMIFRNLLDNAVKYAGDEPKIEISAEPQLGSHVEVRIADNGRGIPPQARRKIFARFERLGSELERDKPGTGLGLYIVWTLVRRLGGRVKMRGREPQAGSVFEVRLPGRAAHVAELNDLEEPANSPSRS